MIVLNDFTLIIAHILLFIMNHMKESFIYYYFDKMSWNIIDIYQTYHLKDRFHQYQKYLTWYDRFEWFYFNCTYIIVYNESYERKLYIILFW